MTETCQAKFPDVARDCCGQWNPRRKQPMFSTGELVEMADTSSLPRGIRPNQLKAFAALVAERAAAAERDACLDLACSYAHDNIDLHDAIRARSKA